MTGSEPPDEPTAGPDETPWRRVHPASLVVNLIPQAWRTLRGSWFILLALFFGGQDRDASQLGVRLLDLSILFAFFAIAIARTVVHFLTLRFRLHRGRLEIKSGLLNRQARIIDPKRIQNVELVQNLFHRASGLVELRVETAGDASTEGLLSALRTDDAEALRDALRRLQRQAEDRAQPTAASGRDAAQPAVDLSHAQVIVDNGVLELVAYGFSRRTVGTVALLTAVFFQFVEVSDPDQAEDLFQNLGLTTLGAMVLLAFAASWAISAGQAVLKHFRYRLLAAGTRLVQEEGLTTRRRVEIPLRKVQIVRADEPLLRRAMGYGTVLIETAGLGVTDGQLRQAEGVVPMVDRDELPALCRRAIPHLDTDPWQAELQPPHPRALYRGAVRRMVLATLLSAGFTALYFPWGALSAAFLMPAGLLVAWLDWRWQGWLVTDSAVISRRGWFTRRTWVVARDKIQSVHVGQSPFMRWHGLGSVVVRAAGSDVELPDLGRDLCLRLMLVLSPEPSAAQQQLDGQHAADDPHQVGGEPGRHGVAQPADADTAEVDGQHVEGGLGAAVHGGDQVADVAVGPVGLDQLGGDAEGAAAGQGPQERQGQGLGRQPQGAGDLAQVPGDDLEPAALPQHADAGQDGDQVRDDGDR
ncbi:MAG: PH domain-containing protein [Alphaproteobacteria bacterium]|nr:PH domain-containing protein [Alphaproteobacteria bacterium]